MITLVLVNFWLLHSVSNVRPTPDSILVSFYVQSVFPSIPLLPTIEYFSELLYDINVPVPIINDFIISVSRLS